MKTLYLVRHAKATREEGRPDAERPLSERGRRDARKMGKRLARRKTQPDLIVSSPARRALTTARIIGRRIGYSAKDIAVEGRLYPGRMAQLLVVIRGLRGRVNCVMLFGHNPGLLNLASHLSPTIARLPTCAVAEFHFREKSWANVGSGSPSSVSLASPSKHFGASVSKRRSKGPSSA